MGWFAPTSTGTSQIRICRRWLTCFGNGLSSRCVLRPLAAKALGITRQAAHVLLDRIGAPVHKLTDRKWYNAWTIIS